MGWSKVREHDANVAYFMIRERLTKENGSPGDQGSALTRNVARSHGSKNLLQRGILYRHEKILLRQGRLHVQTKENNM